MIGSEPISRPEQWRQSLKNWILDATNPPVSGVQIEIAKNEADGQGFVFCLIPESRFKPHRMEFDQRKPYLVRVADNNVVPNPSLLRSMFFPQPRRDIELVIRTVPRLDGEQQNWVYLDLVNVGESSVREGALSVGTDRVGCAFESLCARYSHDEMGQQATFVLDETLHPGMRIGVALIRSDGRYLRVTATLHQLDCPVLGYWVEADMFQRREDRFRLAANPRNDAKADAAE